MRLEDALLCVRIDREVSPEWCTRAIAGGVDMLIVGASTVNAEGLRAIRSQCRAEDALFVLSGAFERADEFDADGLHLDSAAGPVGQARAVAGQDRAVGVSAASVDEARLAVAVGVDFVLVDVSIGPAALYAARAEAVVPVFAAQVADMETAAEAVSSGMYRLCVNADGLTDSEVTERMAEYSRLLGRSI